MICEDVVGQWKYNNNMNGRGTYYFSNGDQYTGDWVDDKRTGQSIFTGANGDRYEDVYSVIYTLFIHRKWKGK